MKLDLQLKNILFILMGTSLVAFGLVHFNIQNELAEGGFTGITLIFYFTFGWKTSISYFLLNIPVFIIGWRLLGKKSIIYTLIGATSLSVWLAIFEEFHFLMPLHDDLMLASLFAGVFAGLGIGITFRYGGTTGGIDIIAKIIWKYYGISPGKTMFIFDIFVLALSMATYLDYKEAMYTLVVVFIATRIIDFLNDGLYDARGAMIISNQVSAIADRIAADLGRGVTFLRGHGYYHKADQDVIYCVVGKNEINQLKEVVTKVDPYAFMTISVVQDVHGEGFTLDANRLPINQE